MFELIKTIGRAVFMGGAGSKGAATVGEVARGVGGWIDDLKLTDQERQEFDQKRAETFNKFLELTADENTERSRTRRDLALLIIRAWLLLLFLSLGVWPFHTEYSKAILAVATGDPMAWLVLGIGGFFYGAHLMRSAKNR